MADLRGAIAGLAALGKPGFESRAGRIEEMNHGVKRRANN